MLLKNNLIGLKNAQNIAWSEGEVDWMGKNEQNSPSCQRTGCEQESNERNQRNKNLSCLCWAATVWVVLFQHDERAISLRLRYLWSVCSKTQELGLRPTYPTAFYTHHHLKVLPEDALHLTVQQSENEINLMALFLPCELWTEVTDPKEIESIILAWNKCHLQQAPLEDSGVHDLRIQPLLENHGTNNLVNQYLWSDITLDDAVNDAIHRHDRV